MTHSLREIQSQTLKTGKESVLKTSLEVTFENTLPPASVSSHVLPLKLSPPPSLSGLQVSLWSLICTSSRAEWRHFEWWVFRVHFTGCQRFRSPFASPLALSGLLSGDTTELLVVEMLVGAVLISILTALPGKAKTHAIQKYSSKIIRFLRDILNIVSHIC